MKHRAHMGVMLLVLLGFGAYYLWDALYGAHGGPASVRVVGQSSARAGADGRL
jgi:hypothetical protein